MEGQENIVLWIAFAAGMLCMVALAAIYAFIRRTAYLSPVKRELKKEKQWLRRGEYNAAMVKGRQNLELLLKLVANNNGIQLDNTAQAVANAKTAQEKNGGQRNRRGSKRVMTYQQFGWWLEENGYLDRVAKWEMNEVRLIGNKAVHENFISKEDAWNQYNYLEDILKTVSEKHPGHSRKSGSKKGQSRTPRQGAADGKKSQNGGKTGKSEIVGAVKENKKQGQSKLVKASGVQEEAEKKKRSEKKEKNKNQSQSKGQKGSVKQTNKKPQERQETRKAKERQETRKAQERQEMQKAQERQETRKAQESVRNQETQSAQQPAKSKKRRKKKTQQPVSGMSQGSTGEKPAQAEQLNSEQTKTEHTQRRKSRPRKRKPSGNTSVSLPDSTPSPAESL